MSRILVRITLNDVKNKINAKKEGTTSSRKTNAGHTYRLIYKITLLLLFKEIIWLQRTNNISLATVK